MNDDGKLRHCTEKNGTVVHLCLAAALVALRVLMRCAATRYEWDERPIPGASSDPCAS